MMKMFTAFMTFFWVSFFPFNIWASGDNPLSTATITLNYRSPQEVLSIIKPFLEKEAKVKAFENQLIIQTTSANLETIKNIIQKVDVPIKKLIISISNGYNRPSNIASVSANGDVAFDSTSEQATATVISTASESDTQINHIRVNDGGVAFISSGVSIPLIRDQVGTQGGTLLGNYGGQSIDYKELNNGFYVRPQLIGKEVKLDLSTKNDQPASTNGDPQKPAYTTFNAMTSVMVPLGQWIYFGGNRDESDLSNNTAYSTASTAKTDNKRSLWLRVDIIPDN